MNAKYQLEIISRAKKGKNQSHLLIRESNSMIVLFMEWRVSAVSEFALLNQDQMLSQFVLAAVSISISAI